MSTRKDFSIVEKLLLAALDLEEKGRTPFTAEELVVAAWTRFPDAFGLAGHVDSAGRPLYPDSNRVFAEIMGSKPIRQRGLLTKVGTKKYRLTPPGVEHARQLAGRGQRETARKALLSREVSDELRRLFKSRALNKYSRGQASLITFHDACSFWGISPRSSAIDLEGRFAAFQRIIASARQAAGQDMASFEHHADFAFGQAELDMLESVHRDMVARFSSDIDTIRRRNDERRT